MGVSQKFTLVSKRRPRISLIVTAVLLLISLSCAMPTINLPQIKSAPTPQATLAAQPTAAVAAPSQMPAEPVAITAVTPVPAEDLPPVLAEVQPPVGSDLPLPASLTFYFSTAMDAESVQRGTQFQPVVSAQFQWLDAATLRVTFPDVLVPENELAITFNNNVRSQAGKFLTEPVQLHFRSPAALQAVERLPRPDASAVDPSAAVAVTFSRAVVPLVGEVTSLPPAFTLEPPAQGRGEWLNTSTYIFYPQPALAGGAQYSVKMNTGLGLEPAQGWSFSTVLPAVVSIEPGQQELIWLDEPIKVTFNQPMDAASVQASFLLQNEVDARIAGKFTWNDDFTEVTFVADPPLARDTAYTLTLAVTAESQGGTPLDRKVTADFRTVPLLSVTGLNLDPGEQVQVYEGYGSLQVRFSGPLAAQDMTELITFSPEVPGFNAYLPPNGDLLTLSGFMQPSTAYTMTLSPGIKDRWGQPLGNAIDLVFTTAAAEPTFRIPMLQVGPPLLFTPTSVTTLPANATNITALDVLSSNLNLPDFFAFVQGQLENYNPAQRSTWQQALDLPANSSQPVAVNLTNTGSPLNPGIYYYAVTSPQLDDEVHGGRQPFVLVVSDIHLLIKRSANSLFVWAYDLAQKSNAARLAVTLYDGKGTVIADLVTDEQGVGQVNTPAGFDVYSQIYAVSGKPGDANFSLAGTTWNQGLSGWEFNLPVDLNGSQPAIYMYTDRPIYRPGQKVYFRGIARARQNGRYAGLEQNRVAVKVLGVNSSGPVPELFNQELALSEFGSFSGEFDLPSDAQPGDYSILAGFDPQQRQQQLNFRVAEYRKPELELVVEFPSSEIQAGSAVQASLRANYYFGAPAGRLPVNWTLVAEPGYFSLPEGFQTGKQDLSWLVPYGMRNLNNTTLVASGEGLTAADGSLVINIPAAALAENVDLEENQRLVLEVTAQDESQQPVSARSSLTLHPASFYVGVRPDNWSAQSGQAAGFDIQVANWQRGPAGEHALRASFQRVAWKHQQLGSGAISYGSVTPQYTEVGSVDFRTDAAGRARLSFTPDQPGTYLLRVSGEGAVSEVMIWAAGPGSAPWPQLDSQHLKLVADAENYRPGDTAKITIPNPFPQGAQALITVERGEIMRWQTLELQGAGAVLDVPLVEADAPNVYLSVTLLNPQANAGLDFRHGYLELKVDPSALKLQVQVAASPRTAGPGDEVRLALQVRDEQGSPVEGEFSLALIDKSVLALADPNSSTIEEAFYGRQPLGVFTSLSTAGFTGRIPTSIPGRGGGGGEAITAVREEFADTAYWNAQVKTDASGSALVTTRLPDNLTTWVLDARGLTMDTRVGSGTAELVTTRDLLVRPALPRFVVAGDHVELAAVVNNNTAAALQVDVTLEADGVTLDQPGQAAVRVEIPANDRRRVAWMATVEDVPAVDVLIQARSGALQDAVRPKGGPLPVLRYTSADTFATAGTLSEATQRTEWVSLPRSFQPQGGRLLLEFTPSLSAAVLDGLKALDSYPTDFSEAVLSRLLANVEAHQALQKLGVDSPELKSALDRAVSEDLRTLARLQNQDGSWGWLAGSEPDPYISAYILYGLTRVQAAGISLPAGMLENALSYVSSIPVQPESGLQPWQLDRLLFQAFALQSAGYPVNLDNWYAVTDRLSPWSNALLAVMINQNDPADGRATDLLSRLEASAERSATGARWSGSGAQFRNYATPSFTTAAVVFALARIDPAAPLLVEGVRYLVSTRQHSGGWYSSYDTAWALVALVEALQGTGDLQARYTYAASLNGRQVAGGSVEGTGLTSPIEVDVPLEQLNAQAPNTLQISRDDGTGRLYYRAFLQVNRPVKDAPPVQRGLSINRTYLLAGQDCRRQACPSLTEVRLGNPAPVVEVRLSITVPADLTNVVVEDSIPAGTEILNAGLKTSQQQGIPEVETEPETQTGPEFNPRDPFAQGWGWWLFHQPQITDTNIRWFAENLPAGSYQLTYRLVLLQTGEYQVLPARAYAYYFPEIQGSSAGEVFKINP